MISTYCMLIFSVFASHPLVDSLLIQSPYLQNPLGGFCSCFTIPIHVDCKESFRGSISITAQCIEAQLIPIERLGRDLQIRHRPLYIVIYIMVYFASQSVNVRQILSPIYIFFLSFLSWPPFGHQFALLYQKNWQ